MKEEQLQDYIGSLLDNPNPENEVAEIDNAILLMSFYIAGVERKDIPLDLLPDPKLNLDGIPEPFHATTAILAILKAKSNGGQTLGYLQKRARDEAGELLNFLTPPINTIKNMPKYRIIKQTKNEIELELIENIQEIPAKKLEWHKETKEMNWNEAQKYAKKLGNGWRLPTVVELLQAYCDKVEGFEEDDYWSSTTRPFYTSYALYAHFRYGCVLNGYKTSSFFVRCVREI